MYNAVVVYRRIVRSSVYGTRYSSFRFHLAIVFHVHVSRSEHSSANNIHSCHTFSSSHVEHTVYSPNSLLTRFITLSFSGS